MKIIGTGRANPAKIVTNAMLEEFLDTSDEWIRERTGMTERHVISNEKLEDLAAEAARKAIEDAGITPEDIDYIICSNVVNEYITPGLSCIIQGAIGAKCACVDVNAACSGFIYALDMADDRIKSGKAKTILVVAAEEPTRMVDWKDRSICVLFGDGAGAAIFRAAEGTGDRSDTGILATKIYADGSQYDHLCSDGGVSLNQKAGFIHMDGKEVFKVAIPSLVQGVEESLKIAGININEVNWYVPHQANLRIIDSVAKKLEIDMDKVVVTVDHHGNTSAASIPLALAESFAAGKFKKGDVIAISAMGAGFTWGGMVIRI